MMNINVIIGPAAIRLSDNYWVGVASGNRYCQHKRRSKEAALQDAIKLEQSAEE